MNQEESGKVSKDPILQEADEDVIDGLVGQAGRMSIEEEDAPRLVESEQETEQEIFQEEARVGKSWRMQGIASPLAKNYPENGFRQRWSTTQSIDQGRDFDLTV